MKPQTFNPAKLENLRVKQGWSRFDVVIRLIDQGLRITDDTLGRWERGENAPGADDLAVLAKFYSVKVEDFYL